MTICSEIRTGEKKWTRRERTLAENLITEIAGDRRANHRYGVELPLEYTVIRNGRAIAGGTGTTIDLSSGGMAFLPGEELEPGTFVEVSIEWPVAGKGERPMELLVAGSVVRNIGQAAAIRNECHEFRTQPQASSAPVAITAGYR